MRTVAGSDTKLLDISIQAEIQHKKTDTLLFQANVTLQKPNKNDADSHFT